MITTEITLKISRPKVKAKYVTTRSYSGYAPDSFCKDLSLVPWHMVYFFDDIDSQVETFNSLFLDVLDQHAPIKRIKIKSRSNPFVTPEIKQLRRPGIVGIGKPSKLMTSYAGTDIASSDKK